MAEEQREHMPAVPEDREVGPFDMQTIWKQVRSIPGKRKQCLGQSSSSGRTDGVRAQAECTDGRIRNEGARERSAPVSGLEYHLPSGLVRQA